jgi:hypothetical protein
MEVAELGPSSHDLLQAGLRNFRSALRELLAPWGGRSDLSLEVVAPVIQEARLFDTPWTGLRLIGF